MATPRELMDRLETRHDELIRKLDELNSQIESTLAQFAKTRSDASNSPAAPVPAEAIERAPNRRAA